VQHELDALFEPRIGLCAFFFLQVFVVVKYYCVPSFSQGESPHESQCQECQEVSVEQTANAHLARGAPRGALRTNISLEGFQVVYIRTLRDAMRVHGIVAQFRELVDQLQKGELSLQRSRVYTRRSRPHWTGRALKR